MERNVGLYPYYQISRHTLFWVPIFFLYFSSRLAIDEVLALEGIYYLSVVLLEVPSGYFSDRFGRRVALMLGNAAGVAAFALFVIGRSFWPLAAAQVLLAVWMSFNSGSDTSLLYDSLSSLGRGAEVGDVESASQSRAYFAYAVSALLGGAAAGLDLRIPYALSGIGALAGLWIAWRFEEPPGERAGTPAAQLRAVWCHTKAPLLRWLFVFVVAMTVFAHVPYMLFQPYLELVFGDARTYQRTPLIAGALVTATMLVSSAVSARAMQVARRFGTLPTLFGALLVQGGVILAMGLILHPAMVLLLSLRSAAPAITTPPMNAAIHARIDSRLRATYFSVQSLAGRLAFSLTLFAASRTVGALDRLTPPALRTLCLAYAAGVVVAALVLAALAARIKPASEAAR